MAVPTLGVQSVMQVSQNVLCVGKIETNIARYKNYFVQKQNDNYVLNLTYINTEQILRMLRKS